MYHYLKWAALSLFLKRNARYLSLVLVGVFGIFLADAIYRDMADLAAKTGQSDRIATYLAIKWLVVLCCGGLTIFSIMKLGFASDGGKRAKEKKKKSEKGDSPGKEEEDAIMRRLEKFKHPNKLRHRSDLILSKRKKRKI